MFFFKYGLTYMHPKNMPTSQAEQESVLRKSSALKSCIILMSLIHLKSLPLYVAYFCLLYQLYMMLSMFSSCNSSTAMSRAWRWCLPRSSRWSYT